MKMVIFGLVLMLNLLMDSQTLANEKFVTIVNPVRSRELWKDKSLKPIDDQYRVINKYDLRATWLIQNDVFEDKELVKKLKNFDENQEMGMFLEVSEKLAYEARVYYPTEAPWYSPGSVFLSGYELSDRKKLIDKMVAEFKDTFGYLPKSVGAWWIDSYSQQYLENKYNIRTFLICADQKTTDKYGIWGQWWGYPYIPSPDNILVPGNSKSVVIQWAQRDLEKAYVGSGPEVSNYSLQANDYISQKLDIKYFEELATKYLNVEKLGQITIGLEVGMESVGHEEEFEKQLKWISVNKITGLRMSDFATQYRNTYDNKNPEKVILGDWILTPKERLNEKLGEKTVYQKNLVFKDMYQKDEGDFLNRIYNLEYLENKRLVNYENLIKFLLLITGFLTAIKFKRISYKVILILGILIWIILIARYSVVDGQIIVGFLIDNFRFVGVNLTTGIMNTDLSNLVAKSMIKLKVDWMYFTYWMILGIIGGKIYGRIDTKGTKNQKG